MQFNCMANYTQTCNECLCDMARLKTESMSTNQDHLNS